MSEQWDGYPPDRNKRGRHWLVTKSDGAAALCKWETDSAGLWWLDGWGEVEPAKAARVYDYLAPCRPEDAAEAKRLRTGIAGIIDDIPKVITVRNASVGVREGYIAGFPDPFAGAEVRREAVLVTAFERSLRILLENKS